MVIAGARIIYIYRQDDSLNETLPLLLTYPRLSLDKSFLEAIIHHRCYALYTERESNTLRDLPMIHKS